MSDLAATRDHYRRMSTAAHTDDCRDPHARAWEKRRPDPACTGCMPPGDRALFAQLAAEIDAYLAGDPDVVAVPTPDDVPLEGL